MLSGIAVHTENLEASWKTLLAKPLVEGCTASTVCSLPAHIGTIIRNVIDGQKQRLGLSTT
jgi:hypothetical protein